MPRVRMGVHTGEAMLVGEQYVGLAVHRGARIAGEARGGEILLSQTTVDLLHDDEDALGVEVVEVGERSRKFRPPRTPLPRPWQWGACGRRRERCRSNRRRPC